MFESGLRGSGGEPVGEVPDHGALRAAGTLRRGPRPDEARQPQGRRAGNDGEDLDLNPSFREFTPCCGIAATPTRPRSPRDKAAAEAAVRAVRLAISLPLQDEAFFRVGKMNEAIAPLPENLDNRMTVRGCECRRQLFEREERRLLGPPREMRRERCERIPERTAGLDCLVRFRNNLHSVPHGLSGRKVAVRAGTDVTEVRSGVPGELVRAHPRARGRRQHATMPARMPERRRMPGPVDRPGCCGRLLGKACRTGPVAHARAERCMASRDFPEQACDTVRSMLRMAERAPPRDARRGLRRGAGR